MRKIDTLVIVAELECIGAKIPFYTSLAKSVMYEDGTTRPMCSADDVVQVCFEKLALKLYARKVMPAETVKHARARFTLFVQGYLRDLRKKRDRVYDSNAIVELHSVDEMPAKHLMETICDTLRPIDALQLQRCADGENLSEFLSWTDAHRLRNRVRKVLEN